MKAEHAVPLNPNFFGVDSLYIVCDFTSYSGNFLLRLEKKNFVRTEKQGNKNLYTPLVRRLTYCGAVSQAHLQTLYDLSLIHI